MWDNYLIEIALEYVDNGGQRDLYTWTHEVGDWTRESSWTRPHSSYSDPT